ncbi:unnamed protein product [Kuraishia capsulata CBS 1993]|uniref:Uncharacterized protein n=1 Tax=Kuraishia capsulata CBS 1993 TaxID=1382522 RepID=W6MMW1_9ASCO|nr:uncharacterized protein KUCA_T00003939001 [Kuraishia capsulata CBS 1993]CDK27959.1 unnamed protein product [Kuraishia capsulata CBS 1993]
MAQRQLLLETPKALVYTKLQVLKRLPQGNILSPNPIASLEVEYYRDVPIRHAYASLFRHFVRLKPLVSSRKDIRELYVRFVKLRFVEDYNLRRLLVLGDSSLPALQREEILDRAIRTLKFCVNAWIAEERTTEGVILKNILDYQFTETQAKGVGGANVLSADKFRAGYNLERQMMRFDLEARGFSKQEVEDALERERKSLPVEYYNWLLEADDTERELSERRRVQKERKQNKGDILVKLHNLGKREFEKCLVMMNETTGLLL